jgi:predicted deacylase
VSAAAAFELTPPALDRWREGNTGTEGVWRFESKQPGREVLVTALVHGNELCGAWALQDLLERYVRPRRGALTLALCNLAAFDRFDARAPDASRFVEQDLNRLWGQDGGTSSVEAQRVRALRPFVERADWLLDLHSMHEPAPPLQLAGPHQRNVRLARELGLAADIVVDAGHAEGLRLRDHGRFGAAGEEGACALLVECGWHGAASSRDVAREVTARFLVASGVIEASDVSVPVAAAEPPPRVLEVTHAIAARSHDTRFAKTWRSGETVAQAGTVLGWRDGEPFTTPYGDCVLVMPSLRQLRPGVTVMRLARAR